jgi:hypothetical protein
MRGCLIVSSQERSRSSDASLRRDCDSPKTPENTVVPIPKEANGHIFFRSCAAWAKSRPRRHSMQHRQWVAAQCARSGGTFPVQAGVSRHFGDRNPSHHSWPRPCIRRLDKLWHALEITPTTGQGVPVGCADHAVAPDVRLANDKLGLDRLARARHYKRCEHHLEARTPSLRWHGQCEDRLRARALRRSIDAAHNSPSVSACFWVFLG